MYVTIDTKPPPMDPTETVTEFSHTHFSRDSDLISLEIQPHRCGCWWTAVCFFRILCGFHDMNKLDISMGYMVVVVVVVVVLFA